MHPYVILANGILCALAWNAFVWWRAWRSLRGRWLVAQGALLLDTGSDDATTSISGALRIASLRDAGYDDVFDVGAMSRW